MFGQTSFREPALSSASQAGMVNNLNDGLACGLFPVLFAAAGLSIAQIGALAAASGLLVAVRMYETHPQTISGGAP